MKAKLFCLPHHNKFVYIPLLHTLQEIVQNYYFNDTHLIYLVEIKNNFGTNLKSDFNHFKLYTFCFYFYVQYVMPLWSTYFFTFTLKFLLYILQVICVVHSVYIISHCIQDSSLGSFIYFYTRYCILIIHIY